MRRFVEWDQLELRVNAEKLNAFVATMRVDPVERIELQLFNGLMRVTGSIRRDAGEVPTLGAVADQKGDGRLHGSRLRQQILDEADAMRHVAQRLEAADGAIRAACAGRAVAGRGDALHPHQLRDVRHAGRAEAWSGRGRAGDPAARARGDRVVPAGLRRPIRSDWPRHAGSLPAVSRQGRVHRRCGT